MQIGLYDYVFTAPGTIFAGTNKNEWVVSAGGNSQIRTGGGHDVIMGQQGDLLNGGNGNDALHGVGGKMFSGFGNDFYGIHMARNWQNDPDHKSDLTSIWADLNNDHFRFFGPPSEWEVKRVRTAEKEDLGFGYDPDVMGVNIIEKFDLVFTTPMPGEDHTTRIRFHCNDDQPTPTHGVSAGNAEHILGNKKGYAGEGDRLAFVDKTPGHDTQDELQAQVEWYLNTSDFLI